MSIAACIAACGAPGTPFIAGDVAGSAPPLAPPPVMHAESNDTIVHARFRHVRFQVWPGVALDLDDLRGRMRSVREDRVVSFDDKHSFVLDIDSGSVGLAAADLARLMNTYVFAYRGAPLRDLDITIDGTHLVQRGVLHKVVDIPFEMTGDVSVTPEGEIRIHPVSMKICTIPGKGLMDALGVTLAKLIDLRGAKGVRVVGNDLLLDPAKLLPPPAITGRVVRADLAANMLTLHFATTEGAGVRMSPDDDARNYMLFRGGTLQFGKLFMVHADMEVADASPGDPFGFDLDRYHEQLVAGYHRTLGNDALLVFMPDADQTKKGAALNAAPSRSSNLSRATGRN